MHDNTIALSLLCISFYIFNYQIRLYSEEPRTFWHAAYDGTADLPLIVAPATNFGAIGQPLSIQCLE